MSEAFATLKSQLNRNVVAWMLFAVLGFLLLVQFSIVGTIPEGEWLKDLILMIAGGFVGALTGQK